MTTAIDTVQAVMRVLCEYYREKDGRPYRLNETQIAVYLDGLAKYPAPVLEAAARQHMRQSAFFPKLSELLAVLEPAADEKTQAHLAWTAFERALGAGGVYRGVTFADGAIGETVRQVFGTWAHACQFETDSPGWAIRRQTFLAIYPTIAARSNGDPVTLRGLHRAEPLLIGPVLGLSTGRQLGAHDDAPSHHEAVALLSDIKSRALGGRGDGR